MKVEKIFLLKRNSEEGNVTQIDDNSDVVVLMEDGNRYIASFYTYESLDAIRKNNFASGENMNGRFFWSKHMLITNSCDLENVTEIVHHLIDEGDFKNVFGLLTTSSTHENQ